MLLGEYDHTIDEKNRLALPAKFRTALAGGVVLTRGLDACVEAYPAHDWQQLVESRLAGLNPLSHETRVLQRFYYTGAVESTPDKQGRVHLPAPLLRHGGLAKDVTVVGSNDHLEIWDRSVWAERLEGIEGSADNVAQRLAEQHR